MLKLETRPQPSTGWTYGSPVLALAFTVLIGVLLLRPSGLLGKTLVNKV